MKSPNVPSFAPTATGNFIGKKIKHPRQDLHPEFLVRSQT